MGKKSRTTMSTTVTVTKHGGADQEETWIEPIDNCATCEHFFSLLLSCEPDPLLADVMAEEAECRRSSPVPGPDRKAVWPLVHGGEICGKYKPRKHSFGKGVVV
jgi:hypothetical protein